MASAFSIVSTSSSPVYVTRSNRAPAGAVTDRPGPCASAMVAIVRPFAVGGVIVGAALIDERFEQFVPLRPAAASTAPEVAAPVISKMRIDRPALPGFM